MKLKKQKWCGFHDVRASVLMCLSITSVERYYELGKSKIFDIFFEIFLKVEKFRFMELYPNNLESYRN